MKTTSTKLVKITAVISLAVLTSCGTSKSVSGSTELSSRVEVDSSKPLASCNRVTDNNLSMNIANVIDADGKANQQWLKLKFQFLSSEITKTGYYLRFYKWRVINNATQLDTNPLEFYAYNYSSGQAISSTLTGVFGSEVNAQTGFYLNLKDDLQNPYQVLKVVAYKTDGTVAASANILIPQFLANPNDYKLNSDGTARNELLQKMHPLFSTNVNSMTRNQIQQNFDQHCF